MSCALRCLEKLYCGQCQKRCTGEVVKVGEQYLHLSCFVCKDCGVSLTGQEVFTREEAALSGAGSVPTAEAASRNKSATLGVSLKAKRTSTDGQQPTCAYYCAKHYHERFGQRCAHCGLYVKGSVLQALGAVFHKDCCKCASCGRQFSDRDAITNVNGKFVCSTCFEASKAPPRVEPTPLPQQQGE